VPSRFYYVRSGLSFKSRERSVSQIPVNFQRSFEPTQELTRQAGVDAHSFA
jgi:hypothetical protein